MNETNFERFKRIAVIESSSERLKRIQGKKLRMVTEGLGDTDIVTECVVDYRDYLWLIDQVEKAYKSN